jgi:hypothetical protein
MSFHKLRVLFPDIRAEQVVMHFDGSTLKILEWRRPEPQPTIAEINAVSDAAANAATETDQLARSFELDRKDRVLIKWIAQLNGLTPAQVRNQLKQIWDNTPP